MSVLQDGDKDDDSFFTGEPHRLPFTRRNRVLVTSVQQVKTSSKTTALSADDVRIKKKPPKEQQQKHQHAKKALFTAETVQQLIDLACAVEFSKQRGPPVESQFAEYRRKIQTLLQAALVKCVLEKQQSFDNHCTNHSADDAAMVQTSTLQANEENLVSNNACCAYAAQVEAVLYAAYFYADPGKYAGKCRSLIYNLSVNGYHLMTRYEPATLCALPTAQLAENTPLGVWRAAQSTNSNTVQNGSISTNSDKDVEEQEKQPAKGQFQCPNPRCKSWHTTYYQLQIRSADEPMTSFCSCLECGRRFKR
jgi:hypothetical protein